MADPTRERPWMSVRLYEVGHGDPLCPDEGLGWYDLLERTWKAGTFQRAANGFAMLEYVEGIGLACRPLLVPQASKLSHWTTVGGQWQEIYPETGPRVLHLDQYDTAASVTSWSATWAFTHPRDPHVAFSLILEDTNSDWDWTDAALFPFVRIELGGEWGVQFTKSGAFLMRFVSGAWQAVADLPSPPRAPGYGDAQAIWIYFRVLRGRVGVSFDFGRSYTWWPDQGGAVTVNPGRIVFRGRGGAASLGVHQLRMVTGTYTSPVRTLEHPRPSATVNFDGSRYDLNGGQVTFTDLSAPLASLAQYRVELQPAVSENTLWDFYASPVLYAVAYDLEPVVQTTGQEYTTPWDHLLLTGKFVEPEQLDGAWGEFTFAQDAGTALDLDAESYRWRLCELWMGWHLSDGSIEGYRVLRGHIETITTSWGEELSKTLVTVRLANASARFKRSPWTPFRQFVLSGRTPNDAADFILARKGLGPTYRNWHVGGQFGVTDPGSPETPNELTPPQELPWETLTRIFEERGLELGVDRDGVYFTVPRRYVAETVTLTVHATAETAPSVWAQAKRLGYTVDFREGATAALAYGTNAQGELVLAIARDADAETNTGSPRFTPLGREMRLRELSGTPNQGLATGYAQALADESFEIHREADFVIPLDITRTRRERVALVGFGACGVPDHTEFVLLTLETTCDLREGNLSLETVGGIKRL